MLAFSITGDTVLDGRYQLEKRLGQGGMGAVYKARHIFLKTQHAIKVILPDLVGNDPGLATRFRQEAMAAAAIRHPNIIAVTDFGVVRGTMPFLVMEFIKGKSLQDVINEEGRLSPERALEILAPVCAGLEIAHRQGIVHRDLKPLNIMLVDGAPASEGVKVLDFGLAKIKSGELLGSFVAAQTTGMMGSPLYMAPEQWGDDDPDARADIYSLGVILYQLLTGETPFKGTSIPSIMNKHLTQMPAELASLGVKVPPAVEAVVRHALEKDPAMRPQSATEFINELHAAVMGAGEATAPNLKKPESVGVQTVYADAETSGASSVVGDPAATQVGGIETEQLRGVRALKDMRETVADFQRKSANGDYGNATRAAGDASLSRTQGAATALDMQGAKTVVANSAIDIGAPSDEKRERRAPVALIASILAALVVASAVGFYVWRSSGAATTDQNVNANVAPSSVVAQNFKPDMAAIPGGSFKMGRDAAPSSQNATELIQSPAHAVTVKPFSMDKTEVTNGEYAAFVQATGHKPPSDWNGATPPAGRERYPVANVDAADAEAFAAWRSKRDGVTYRLPTEEEWEYAARGGAKEFIYPWGNQWLDGFANVGVGDENKDAPKPVGSYPQGNSPFGIEDMIGNVWEWTSSKASRYPGASPLLQLKPEQMEWRVRRGGGYTFVGHRPTKEIPATFREFVPASAKSPTLGFRLVRDGN